MNKRRQLFALRRHTIGQRLASVTERFNAVQLQIGEIRSTARGVPSELWRERVYLLLEKQRVEDQWSVLLKEMNDSQPCKQHIVQFSGGIGSAYSAKRVVDRFGRDNVTLLFADVKMEDPDLYRFNQEVSAYLEVPITVLCDGRTPWDVFFDKRYLGNTRADPCSLVLKRELLWAWIERNAPKGAVVYVGIDWTEEHRLERLRQYRPTVRIEAPLMWPPMPEKPQMLKECITRWKIKPCSLYDHGFSHANCAGFCIKSGQSQFRLLLKVYPDRYAFHEQKEQELRKFLNKDIAILRDRRGGVTRPLTLKEFRERIERGEEHDKHDWGGCGCAIE